MKVFKNYELSIDVTVDGTKRVMCRSLINPVEVSYHDFDELADTDEEALDFFEEWLEERETHREEFKEYQLRNQKL